MKARKFGTILLTAVIALNLSACQKSTSSTTVEKSKNNKTLKVVTAMGNKEKIFAEFQKDTGIKVEFLDISSGEVLSRAKAQKGKPVADAWFGGGADGFAAAADNGLLEKYVSKEAANIPDEYKDKDGYWTGMTLVNAGFVVNKDVLKEKNLPIPQNWADLTNPIYKDEILMPNPNISGTSYCIISSLMQVWGEDKAWAYFNNLNKNISYYPQRGGEPPQKAIAGEVAIAISPIDGEQIAKGNGHNVLNIFPKDGVPWTPAPVAIFKGAENMDAAKTFVDWVLSKKGQETIVKLCPRMAARTGVDVPDVMKGVNSANLMKIDTFKAVKDRDKILKTWNEKMKK